MKLSLSARLFGARLRLYAALARAVRSVDGSDLLTVLCLVLLFTGLAMVAVPLAFIVVGFLIALMTPVGTALRLFIRGR